MSSKSVQLQIETLRRVVAEADNATAEDLEMAIRAIEHLRIAVAAVAIAELLVATSELTDIQIPLLPRLRSIVERFEALP